MIVLVLLVAAVPAACMRDAVAVDQLIEVAFAQPLADQAT